MFENDKRMNQDRGDGGYIKRPWGDCIAKQRYKKVVRI